MKYNPIAETLRRRADAGECLNCGTKLEKNLKGRSYCPNELCRAGRGAGYKLKRVPNKIARLIHRRTGTGPAGPSEKALARKSKKGRKTVQ